MQPMTSSTLTELLTQLQQLQSVKDGIKRPAPGHAGVQADEVLDAFAQQILHACGAVSQLDSLRAMHLRLADKGRELEQQGVLTVPVGGDFAQAALDYLCPAGATEK